MIAPDFSDQNGYNPIDNLINIKCKSERLTKITLNFTDFKYSIIDKYSSNNDWIISPLEI